MSTSESSYKSLLQGVSQQIPSERLPGQLTAQENMLSDAVTNVRRRPGAEFKFSREMVDGTSDSVCAWFTDIAGERVHVILNCADGEISILGEDYTEQAVLDGSAYLAGSTPSRVRATTVGDEFFILNRDVAPTAGATPSGVDPSTAGYFFVVSGAFSRKYEVSISTSVGTITANYVTPSGSGAGDAALTTPDYIANQLYTSLNASLAGAGLASMTLTGAYVYTVGSGGTTNVAVNTTTGTAYIIGSRNRYATVTGNLPAQLPSAANGFIMAVGDTRTPQYYKFQSSDNSWQECGVYGSPGSLEDMPVSITYDGATWGFVVADFEGRLAGDDESNALPHFLETGITGISAYQGRLVLLAGNRVNMSASNKPRRFFRSTVTSVLDSDPIEVGASANSSASYEYALPFQKDLILFSEKYQALVPSGNQAITPRTANVVLTSTYEADMTSAPVTLGRTLMYPTPRSADFFGVLEMVPSPYTDSQYVSTDSTPHLPKYLGGRCRFSVSSSTAGMVLFAPTGDKNSLIVHEYLWDADKKVQQAWHRWTFPYEVATAYFASNVITLLFVQNDTLVGCTIDPKVGVLTLAAERKPFLDMYVSTEIVDRVVTPPTWMTDFDPDILDTLKLSVITGTLAGDEVGFEVDAPDLITVRSFPDGDVAVGIPYRSSLSPTPPMIRDFNEVVVRSNKQTLLRYLVGTKNSAQFKVNVTDGYEADPTGTLNVGTLTWSSSELELGQAKAAGESVAIVPCRTNAASTVFEMFTEGTGEFNLTSLEYVMKYHQKIKRR